MKFASTPFEVTSCGFARRRARPLTSSALITISTSLPEIDSRLPTKLPKGMDVGLNATATYVAPVQNFPNGCHVCEVELDPETAVIQVVKYTAVNDCGTVVNPGTVAQQVESSVNFALSAALFGKIDIQEGVVQQTNFTNYPLVNLALSPVVETHIVSSTLPPEGVGEPAVPPLAPAVANAMFALTRQRVRSLPFTA